MTFSLIQSTRRPTEDSLRKYKTKYIMDQGFEYRTIPPADQHMDRRYQVVSSIWPRIRRYRAVTVGLMVTVFQQSI